MAQARAEESCRQPLHTATDDGDTTAGLRRLERLDAFAAFLFDVGHKAFDMVDGHRLIHILAPTLVFAGTRTDAADDRREGVALLDDLNRTPVIPFGGPVQILANVDARRAGTLAGRGAFLAEILLENPARHRCQVDDRLRANPLTGTAARAFHFVDHRQALGAHRDGIERTGAGAGSQTEAADGADLHAAA